MFRALVAFAMIWLCSQFHSFGQSAGMYDANAFVELVISNPAFAKKLEGQPITLLGTIRLIRTIRGRDDKWFGCELTLTKREREATVECTFSKPNAAMETDGAEVIGVSGILHFYTTKDSEGGRMFVVELQEAVPFQFPNDRPKWLSDTAKAVVTDAIRDFENKHRKP